MYSSLPAAMARSHRVEQSSANLLVSGSNPSLDIVIMSVAQTLHHIALNVKKPVKCVGLEHQVIDIFKVELKHLEITGTPVGRTRLKNTRRHEK